MADWYKPTRPISPLDYTDLNTPSYLQKYASKIRYDLEKYQRLYTGKKGVLYTKDRTKQRCTECTDLITGASVLSDCPVCAGTGYIDAFVSQGDVYARIDYAPHSYIMNETGNAEVCESTIYLSTNIIIDERDLLAVYGTMDIFQLIGQSTQVAALKGSPVMQVWSGSLITKDSSLYDLLNWK